MASTVRTQRSMSSSTESTGRPKISSVTRAPSVVLRLAVDLVTMHWALGVEAHKVLSQRSAPKCEWDTESNQGPCLSHACQAAMVEGASAFDS